MKGQVERWHATLAEIMRCLKKEGSSRSFEELLQRTVNEYNFTIHSTTGKKLEEIYLGRIPNLTPEELKTARTTNIEKN